MDSRPALLRNIFMLPLAEITVVSPISAFTQHTQASWILMPKMRYIKGVTSGQM